MNLSRVIRLLSVCAVLAAWIQSVRAGEIIPPAVAEPTTRSLAGAPIRGTFALDGDTVRFYSPMIHEPLRVMLVSDSHLGMDDERGAPYRAHSKRMAEAYVTTKDARTGAETTPQAAFERSLTRAAEAKVDLFAMLGDIFSFPSEAAIDWVGARLGASALPYLYISGNHDWHYEGMEGTRAELRATWTAKRLGPLYQGADPLMAARDIKGVRFVAIDDSTCEIEPEQLAFFREQVASGRPLVLLLHVPLYAPGRPVGFACGHPDWGAGVDQNYAIERRPPWPEGGHDATTLAFHREVFAAPNLLAVFAGHIHQASLDVVGGVPQFVLQANVTGGSMTAEFLPPPAR